MAIYHLSAQIIGKGAGRSAVAAAAYRHCAKMERTETAEEIDYSRKSGNAHSEFALPETAPSWIANFAEAHSVAETSAYFWNAVEANETRSDAQLMREIVLALPVELTTEQNIELVRDFVDRELCAHGIVVDWAYHDMADNPHVHLMTSLRPLTDNGFGAKRVPVLGKDGEPLRGADGKIRYEQFTGGMERLKAMREAWAEIQNHHLAKHGHDIRVDHRSFEDMGIDAVPSTHRGPAADNMDARGEKSELAEKARLAARESYERFAEDPSLVLKKITVQKAVFTKQDIAREIHRTECTPSEFQALYYQVGALDELVPVAAPSFDPFTGEETSDALFSTRTMVALEHRMLQNIESLSKRSGANVSERALQKAYHTFEQDRGFALNAQQTMVVEHLTGQSGAAALVGYAGAGKSTAIDATRRALESAGYTVIGGALAGIAADNLRSESGVQSRTLASWEYQWAKGDLLPDDKTVFIMDEAGMVSSSQMERITRELDRAGARMIVLGDARQLQPIQAGAAFRAFVDVTGYVELDSVVRQSEPWMREAAVAFGSGAAKEGLAAYLERDKFSWSDSNEAARAALIRDWIPFHQANADVTMMAHRNKDVIALNVEAREALRSCGALGPDHAFAAERGRRSFAKGDRILFLKNERSLGVFNGSSGTVQRADRNCLDVLVDGQAEPIRVRANEYNTLDHGYARTIHKEQGNTVDQAFVYLSPTMDAQLSYVALTRHRDDVKLYASKEDFRSAGELREVMTRDRLQDSTALYRETEDYADVVRGFAERRGFPTTQVFAEFVKSNVAYLRERFDRLAAAFDNLRRPVPSKGVRKLNEADPKTHVPGPARPPDISRRLSQSMNRLSHSLASEHMSSRKGRLFKRSAHFELNVASSAGELRSFNQIIRGQISGDAILTHGSHQPTADAAVLRALPSEWQDFTRSNWDAIFASQWAETQANLQPLKSTALDQSQVSGPKTRVSMSTQKPTSKPLIEAAPGLPPLSDRDVRARAVVDPGLEYAQAIAGDVAGRVFTDRKAVVQSLISRYVETGNAPELLSELERNPVSFGDLKGATRLGMANAERRNALEQVPGLAEKAGALLHQAGLAETRVKDSHQALQAARAKPIVDLSKPAQRFLQRLGDVDELPASVGKTQKMVELMQDQSSIREITTLRKALSERYGKDHGKIREGLSKEPALSGKQPPERQIVLERVNTVLTRFPVMAQMQDQVRQHERSRSLGKDQSRGIER